MAVTLEEVEAQARSLSAEDRARLVEALLESLQEPISPDAEAAWAVEVERRDAQIQRGEVALLPGPETLAQLRSEFS
jgi:putative addiction module component (TIGR02574 family)